MTGPLDKRCHFCGELWPCATVTAIRDAIGGAA